MVDSIYSKLPVQTYPYKWQREKSVVGNDCSCRSYAEDPQPPFYFEIPLSQLQFVSKNGTTTDCIPSYIEESIVRDKLDTANQLFSSGKSLKAIIIYESILSEHPGSELIPRILLNLGEIFYDSNEHEKATYYYQIILDKYPYCDDYLEAQAALINLSIINFRNKIYEILASKDHKVKIATSLMEVILNGIYNGIDNTYIITALKDAEDIALTVTDAVYKGRALMQIAEAKARLGLFDEALNTVNKIDNSYCVENRYYEEIILAKILYYMIGAKASHFDDNIFDQIKGIDPSELFIRLGIEIGKKGNSELFNVMYKNMYEARENQLFARYASVLLGALRSWDKQTRPHINLSSLCLDKLKSHMTDIDTKKFCIFALANIIDIYRYSDKAAGITRELLTINGELRIFILRNLFSVKKYLPLEAKRLVDEEVNKLLVSPYPPYSDWFNKSNNPHAVINAKVYFQRDQQVWEKLLLLDGYRYVVANENNNTIMQRIVNGVTLRVEMVDISNENRILDTNISHDLTNPNIHHFVYNGHSGMGGNLEVSVPGKADMPFNYGNKVMQIAACSSMPSYYPSMLKRFPGIQFIGNVSGAYSEDDAKVFIACMNGYAHKESWQKINSSILKKAPFLYQTVSDKSKHFINHMLPNDTRQFDYAVINPLEERGINALFFSIPAQNTNEINQQFGGRLRQALHNVNVSFRWRSIFKGIEFICGDEARDGIYFQGPKHMIYEIAHLDNNRFSVEVNAGYSHLSVDALTILLLYELNGYFSKYIHENINKEDKLRGLLMTAEYIHYHYQGRESEGLQIFELLKDKYVFSKEIQYKEVYELQKAIDDKNKDIIIDLKERVINYID